METHQIVSEDEWLAARKALLSEERAFTHARDALAAKRQALPWVRVEKTYRFETPQGTRTLAELFDVYHTRIRLTRAAWKWRSASMRCSNSRRRGATRSTTCASGCATTIAMKTARRSRRAAHTSIKRNDVPRKKTERQQ